MTALTVPQGAIKTPYSPLPCGNRLTIPFLMNWTATDEFTIDFSAAINLKTIDSIQSFFVDNFNNSNDLQILVGGTNQLLVVPAASQAYLPVIAREYPVFTFTSAQLANQLTRILANNFPTPTHVWTP